MNRSLFSVTNFLIVGLMAYIFIFVANRLLKASGVDKLQAGS